MHSRSHAKKLAVVLLLSGSFPSAVMLNGQDLPPVNYDESRVPHYTLPDLLVMSDGRRVTTAEQWQKERRPEILKLFEKYVYGRTPSKPVRVEWTLVESSDEALQGKAIRKQLVGRFPEFPNAPEFDLLVYLPKSDRPVPVFIGLNFQGNHTIHPDPAIRVTRSWVRNNPQLGVTNNRASEASRGAMASRWPVEYILGRGYGVATMYYGDIDPDYDDGFQNGIHPLFYEPGQTRPKEDEWGSIGAWAWGLQRALDYLVSDPNVDPRRICLMGHSRLGKTALWAGAQDERFALVVSNNSGCGGAALSRREFGETVKRINTSFPHWFNDVFPAFNDRVNELPVDQHMLVALIAPRPVLICSAEEDLWADPRGEFLSALHADPVYRLLGTDGLAVREMPGLKQFIASRISYHIRPGKHDVTPYDWQVYLDFADLHLRPDSSRKE
ncbi:MAG: acetylxylan esterase [Pirellulaceae bacterium]|nr:MAG: acetylxylan esterase [Pirellulaceae bacterium]